MWAEAFSALPGHCLVKSQPAAVLISPANLETPFSVSTLTLFLKLHMLQVIKSSYELNGTSISLIHLLPFDHSTGPTWSPGEKVGLDETQ